MGFKDYVSFRQKIILLLLCMNGGMANKLEPFFIKIFRIAPYMSIFISFIIYLLVNPFEFVLNAIERKPH